MTTVIREETTLRIVEEISGSLSSAESTAITIPNELKRESMRCAISRLRGLVRALEIDLRDQVADAKLKRLGSQQSG